MFLGQLRVPGFFDIFFGPSSSSSQLDFLGLKTTKWIQVDTSGSNRSNTVSSVRSGLLVVPPNQQTFVESLAAEAGFVYKEMGQICVALQPVP